MLNLLPVPFRGTTLYVVDIENVPYTPMKPIVEGMGLDWSAQYKKLNENKDRFCIAVIAIQIPGDDQNRENICIPVRKLPGWMMTIQPSRVKPELRTTIIAYQNECDDVLWNYWDKGRSTNYNSSINNDFTNPVAAIRALADNLLAWAENYDNKNPVTQVTNQPICRHIIECEYKTYDALPPPPTQTALPLSPPQNCTDIAFFAVLWKHVGVQPFTTNELYQMLLNQQYPLLSQAALELMGDSSNWSARKLGAALNRWSKINLSCHRIIKSDQTKRGIVWRLERIN